MFFLNKNSTLNKVNSMSKSSESSRFEIFVWVFNNSKTLKTNSNQFKNLVFRF